MEWPFRSRVQLPAHPVSRLLALPPEIRSAIYEFALTSDVPVVAFRLDEYQQGGYQEAVQPGLTRVNRQIRNETLPIFYNCNDIVLHTERPQSKSTEQWLLCTTAHFGKLNKLSIWMRYATLTNNPNHIQGGLGLTIQRAKPSEQWRVLNDWKWITVTRKPAAIESDARFLIAEMRKMLQEQPFALKTPDTLAAMLIDLKMIYIADKMS